MNGLFETVAWNSLTAAALAVLVLLAGRVWKRPELLHVLWLVVLVKLVSPGVIRLAAVPLPAASAVPGFVVSESLPSVAPAALVTTTDTLRLSEISFALWIGGSLLLLAFVGLQYVRFVRIMRNSTPVGGALRERIEELAERLRVQAPSARVIDAPIPPLVWGVFGRGTLVLPAGLLARLEPDETDTLVAHELAHLKRRDPWVRWIELAVTASLWWNPLVWWVRRNLRRVEELACDRRVLELLPGAQRPYADSIVKTVEFLAGYGRAPALATGATGTRSIKERLTMILNPRPERRLRRPLVPALMLAFLALPIVPGFADRDDADAERAHAEMLELEREALELEQKLDVIRAEQMEIEKRIEETRFRRKSFQVQRTVEELRGAGKSAEAAQLEAEIESRRRERAFEVETRKREHEMRRAEILMREAAIESERARRAADHAAAEEFERSAAEYERRLLGQAESHEAAQRAYEKALQSREREHDELAALMEEYSRLSPADRKAGAEAERLAQEMRKLQQQLERYAGSGEDDPRALEREIRALTQRLRELETRQREDGAR